jgi:hypothetical protein
MKYIICEGAIPVLFHDAIGHDCMRAMVVDRVAIPTSAGFFRIDNGQVVCYGRSKSLNMGPDNGDAGLIQDMLFGGGV